MGAFVHPLLLAGLALVAVPIVLHLIMRQQPKHLLFPALRFIQARRDVNRRRMRLRHWILLALRCAAIALIAFAVSRPRIMASGIPGSQKAPIAVAMIFDTLPRMQYKHQNKTRLEVAQEMAMQLLKQFPPDSQIAVLDARPGPAVNQVDIGSVRQRISRLEATDWGESPPDRCLAALDLLKKSDLARKEIYVFTDLARAGWPERPSERLRARVKEMKGAGIYLVDVGTLEPQNISLGQLRMSGQVLPKNSRVQVGVDVSKLGSAAKTTLELDLVDSSGRFDKRGQQTLTAAAGPAQQIDFALSGLDQGTHQGVVRILGEDGLPADNARYFTIDVRKPWKVLVAAQAPETRHAYLFTEALAPSAHRKNGQARFECTVVPYARLAEQKLGDYAAVCLLDPGPLVDDTWQLLADYVRGGKGLGIFLGAHALPASEFNKEIPQRVLPAPLTIQARYPDADLFLTLGAAEHPLLANFRPLRGAVPWDAFPIYRYWELDTLHSGTGTIITYGNGKPALLERPLGKGRVLTLTTPISDLGETSEDDRWNLLATGFEPWPFLMLANELTLYLVGSNDSQLNYLTGQIAVVPLGDDKRFPTYLLSTPKNDQLRLSADTKQSAILVAATTWPGNYRLRAGGARDGFDRGFSTNLPTEATALERLTKEELDARLKGLPAKTARSLEEIDRAVTAGRVGVELFPWLMALLAIAVGIEQVMSNRFYRNDKQDSPPLRKAA